MAWNTQYMQRAVERIEAIGGEPLRLEDWRRIAPPNQEGIKLCGTVEFSLERYAGRILPSTADSEILGVTKRMARIVAGAGDGKPISNFLHGKSVLA